jgi:parallel beta-helix repeat protein
VGIYLDDETDDVRVYDNVVYGVNMGVHLHGCPKNVLENNFFGYCGLTDISIQPEAYNICPMNTSFCRNVMYMGFGKVFESGETWSKTWDRKPIGDMDHNIYWRNGQKINLGVGHLEGFDKNSSIADPFPERASGPAGDSFTIKFNEQTERSGIHQIDIKGVGLSRTSTWTEQAGKIEGVTFPLSEEQIKSLSIMRDLKR